MTRTFRLLGGLLVGNLVASLLHFGHNILRFPQYPEPPWISGPHTVGVLWLAMTPLLPLGWILAVRRARLAALAVLWVYATLSLLVLGHYFHASPSTLSLVANVLITLEACAAGLLLFLLPVAIPQVPVAGR